jgi:hypothetical protein
MVFFSEKVKRPIKIPTLDETRVPLAQTKPIFCGAHYYWWRNNHDIVDYVFIFGRFS